LPPYVNITLPANKAIALEMRGSYSALSAMHVALGQELNRRGLKQVLPGIEEYPVGPQQTADENEFVTRIIYPRDLCVAYKPNTAFYEALGLDGMRILKETIDYIGDEHFTIADAKRGDIGNTSRYYASFAFNTLGADSITVLQTKMADALKKYLP